MRIAGEEMQTCSCCRVLPGEARAEETAAGHEPRPRDAGGFAVPLTALCQTPASGNSTFGALSSLLGTLQRGSLTNKLNGGELQTARSFARGRSRLKPCTVERARRQHNTYMATAGQNAQRTRTVTAAAASAG